MVGNVLKNIKEKYGKELADKLQNLISDYHLFLNYGKNVLTTEGKGYKEIKWYYTKLKEIFKVSCKTTSV